MSGTSHDGLDIACCNFNKVRNSWKYEIVKANTIPYPDTWKSRLMNLLDANKETIDRADLELGTYIGDAVNNFISSSDSKATYIGSHGHTIFHQPDQGLTLQIGDGQMIADKTGLIVISDFRSQDVAMGGQGAPLVPLGDRLLFSPYDYCLNLGGISNISFESNEERIAFDICPVNMVLDHLVSVTGKEYDDKGRTAAGGRIIPGILEELEGLPFYQSEGPKSLGREWVVNNIFPILDKYRSQQLRDRLATFTEHIALRISACMKEGAGKSMLVSGGGVYNNFLIKRMRKHCQADIIVPEPLLIEYKEAMIFAFLGLLKMRGEVNVLGSVTGAGKDHSAGKLTKPDRRTKSEK